MRFTALWIVGATLLVGSCDESTTTGLATGTETILQGEFPSAEFGASGDLAGDLNGDGLADIAVGAPGDPRGGDGAGAVFVFHGLTTGPASTPDARLVGGAQDRFGEVVTGIGDVNSDGFEDLAVLARGAIQLGASGTCAVFVFFGSSSGLLRAGDEATDGVRQASTADIVILSSAAGPCALSSAGDLDQNGLLDLAIGVPDESRVYVFLNSRGTFPIASLFMLTDADVIFTGQSDEKLGASVSAAGDVNALNRGAQSRFGDDLLIGAPQYQGKGRAYLVLGRAGFTGGVQSIESEAIVFNGEETNGEFGGAVAGLGDFDGDSIGDIAIGSPGNGRTFIYFGTSVLGPQTTLPTILVEEGTGDRLGESIAGGLPLGVNGAFGLVAGAPENDFGGVNAGSVYFASNRIFTGDSAPRGVQINAAATDARFRNSRAGAGTNQRFGAFVKAGLDINGDGSGDLLIGMPGANSSGKNTGAVAVEW